MVGTSVASVQIQNNKALAYLNKALFSVDKVYALNYILGMTPLMLAASRSNMSNLVETFLNYEADPYAKDSRGFTALR